MMSACFYSIQKLSFRAVHWTCDSLTCLDYKNNKPEWVTSCSECLKLTSVSSYRNRRLGGFESRCESFWSFTQVPQSLVYATGAGWCWVGVIKVIYVAN